MIDLYSGLLAHVSAPPLVPDERPIDVEHLFRMTLGDHHLEREVLQLFDHQAGMLMERISQSSRSERCEPGIVAAAAHTMKGSARGIGAWQLARAAEAVENAALGPQPGLAKTVTALSACVDEARAAIAELLRAH
jgi:HPt (histidine-containing phosphotransfer) domain-containing protein